MKNIDIKSLIIGALLTSTIFLGVAATGPRDEWSNKQEWRISEVPFSVPQNSARYKNLTTGMEPFAINGPASKVLFRKRIK